MDKLESCINISRLMPISKLEQNINAVSTLIYNDDEVLENFLQKVDQPLIVRPEDGRFVCCEYNRDGDSYRNPNTNKYYPPLGDGKYPPEPLRQLETKLNQIFRVYTNFYYSNQALSSVYCYELDSNNDNVHDNTTPSKNFVVAVLIKHKLEDSSKIDSGVWDASNLVIVTINPEGQRKVKYKLISNVNVYLNFLKEKKTKIAIGGSMTKESSSEYDITNVNVDDQYHVEKIGTLIEDLETRIREEIEVIYFKKTTEIIDAARYNYSEGKPNKDAINDLRNVMGK